MGEVQEALVQVREERDALAAGLGQMLEARSAFMGRRSSSADSFSAFLEAARDVEDATTAILAARDARMKAEALECAIKVMSQPMTDGGQPCLIRVEDVQAMAAEYREQAEGEA